MAKRKRTQKNNFSPAIVFRSDVQRALFIVMYFLFTTLVGSAIIASAVSLMPGQTFLGAFRLAMVGAAIPIVFMLAYRLKTGRWWEA